MVELQKFLFTEDYSQTPENIQKIEAKRRLDAKDLLKDEIDQEVQTAKELAFRQGMEQGERQAFERLKKELDTHIDNISVNMSQVEKYKQELLEVYEQHALLAVKHIAANLFFKADELFPKELLAQSIENALDHLPNVNQINIKVPTAAKSYIKDTSFEEKLKQRNVYSYKITEDSSLNSGESIIEWDNGGILSSKKETLKKIENSIKSFINKEDFSLEVEKEEELQVQQNQEVNIQEQTGENSEPVTVEAQIAEAPETQVTPEPQLSADAKETEETKELNENLDESEVTNATNNNIDNSSNIV